ncbi:uncharacterized protein [Asterias amurensis]|uniref:uncharacterized protein n=1 Tax=Asterias amurensis TaxID=7602 RepID=UPI003AB157B7
MRSRSNSLCLVLISLVFTSTTMAHGGHPTKSVVIIGAGIGGTSCAHYLSKQDPIDKITIFEAQDDVGGRIKDVSFWNTTVGLGAKFVNAGQRHIAELAKDLNLTVRSFQHTSYPKIFVWDGAHQLQTTTDVLARNPGAETEMQSRLTDYSTAVKKTYDKYASRSVFESVHAYLRAGGLDEFVGRSASAYFSDGPTPLSQEAQDYLIEPVSRQYFGQGLESQSMIGMVCLEGLLRNSFYIEGGMSKLVRGLVESSGADLNLNSRVTHIIRKTQEEASQQYTVKYVTDGVAHEIDADAVVIAAPLEWADIKFEGFYSDPSTTQPRRSWNTLYTYVSFVVAESLRPSYFPTQEHFINGSSPLPLLTTSNQTLPWVSIYLQETIGRFNLYQVTSPINLTQNDLLGDLFDGVQEVMTQSWDYVFPLSPPIIDEYFYQSLALDDRVFNLNGMESVASQMETSVISARNVARWIAKGNTSSFAATVTSSLRIVTGVVLFNLYYYTRRVLMLLNRG